MRTKTTLILCLYILSGFSYYHRRYYSFIYGAMLSSVGHKLRRVFFRQSSFTNIDPFAYGSNPRQGYANNYNHSAVVSHCSFYQ